jgi:hypothetical protein
MNALDDGDWQLAYDGSGHPTIHRATLTGLKKGMHYRFKYTSSNMVGESANSTEATLLCAATPSAPSAPELVSSSTSQIVMQWEAPAQSGGALIETYEIFYK